MRRLGVAATAFLVWDASPAQRRGGGAQCSSSLLVGALRQLEGVERDLEDSEVAHESEVGLADLLARRAERATSKAPSRKRAGTPAPTPDERSESLVASTPPEELEPPAKDVSSTWLATMNTLLKQTYLGHTSWDRKSKGEELPASFTVIRVDEIQNEIVEKRYNDYKQVLKNSVKSVREDECLSKRGPTPRTMQVPELVSRVDKDPCLNEVFLFHGTDMLGSIGISRDGHDMSRAGKAQGTMLGPGYYMADSSTKADEYTKLEPVKGHVGPVRRMLLERVLLGRPLLIILEPSLLKDFKQKMGKLKAARVNLTAMEAWLKKEGRHSILRDGENKNPRPTFKEFALFKSEAALPSFIIYYRRDGEEPVLEPTPAPSPQVVAPAITPSSGGTKVSKVGRRSRRESSARKRRRTRRRRSNSSGSKRTPARA